jgi:hypothetical protein
MKYRNKMENKNTMETNLTQNEIEKWRRIEHDGKKIDTFVVLKFVNDNSFT